MMSYATQPETLYIFMVRVTRKSRPSCHVDSLPLACSKVSDKPRPVF